jgi:hypothetical protein
VSDVPVREGPCSTVWLLNFDAEAELACTGPYSPRALSARASAAQARVAQTLLGPSDSLLEAARWDPTQSPRGRAWCPTPSARARFQRAGIELEPGPALDVLRTVNNRRFCLPLRQQRTEAIEPEAVTTEAELTHLLKTRSRPLLFKRVYSCAGQAQLRLTGEPSTHDQRVLRDALTKGGLVAERFVDIELEVSLHGELTEDGRVRFGQPCRQHVDAQRAFVAAAPLLPGQLAPEHLATLTDTALAVAERLKQARYFGPFGIDAYVWSDQGTLRFNPLSEVNARYTMAFGVGMPHTPTSRPNWLQL